MQLDWFEVLMAAVPLVLGAVVGFLFAVSGNKLRALKQIWQGEPVWAILGAAAVMIAEAVWSAYGGDAQFAMACLMVSKWLGHVLTAEQVATLVQRAYVITKGLLGQHWNSLKLDLAGEIGTTTAIVES